MINPTNERNILRNYQYSSIVLGLSFCLFYIYANAWISLFGPAIFTSLVFMSLLLERRNQPKLASIILVISLWLAPAWCILFSGGLHSPLLIWMTPTLLMAGALLGSRWAILIGSLSAIYITIVSFNIEPLIQLSEFSADDRLLNLLFILSATSAIGLITFYGYSFTKEIKDHLNHLGRNENELINHRDNLGKLVDKRTHELQIANEEVEAANELKMQFIGNMSHELRTPLNGIIGMSQLLSEGNLEPDSREYLAELSKSADRLTILISDLLIFSNIVSNNYSVQSKPFNLNDLVNVLEHKVSTLAQDNGLKFQLNIKPGIPTKLIGDMKELGRVLYSLGCNAVKFTPPGGTVEINIGFKEDSIDNVILTFSFQDSGIGIEPKYLDKIFQPFTQIDGTTTRQYSGTGLGLSLCKKQLKIMGGDIRVESEYGKGSEFYITVPLKKA